jgi:hypothetical protein
MRVENLGERAIFVMSNKGEVEEMTGCNEGSVGDHFFERSFPDERRSNAP